MNKKKVYTVTFHRANNYGAVLQAYALQKFLMKKYDSKIVDYDNLKMSNYYRLIIIPHRNIYRVVRHIIPRLYKIRSYIKREKAFNRFRDCLEMTENYTDIDNLKKNFHDCDVLVTGSDQVWNPGITGGYNDGYFLNFGNKSAKRIAYAASCGDVSKVEAVELLKRIDNFDAVSVREKQFQEYLQSNMNKSAFLACDPTLLLSKDEWMKLVDKNRIVNERYIFCYSVGNGTPLFYDCVNYLAKKYGYLVVYFDKTCPYIKTKKKSFYCGGPEDFLNLLYYSEFCITTSFHGSIFSAIFNKNFFSVLSSYSERLITLLDSLSLKSRIVSSLEDMKKIENKQIDWNMINNNIWSVSSKSANWLLEAIGGEYNGKN